MEKLAKNPWKWPNIYDFFFIIFYFRHFFMDIFKKSDKKEPKMAKNGQKLIKFFLECGHKNQWTTSHMQ